MKEKKILNHNRVNRLTSLLALIMLSAHVYADGNVTIIKLLNGAANGSPDEVTSSVSDGVCTLTVTPAAGNYITVDFITAERIVSGGTAQAPRRALGMENSIEITATDADADPSGVTTYTFTMPEDYDVEVVADFQNRTSVSGAVVTLAETSFVYDGTEKTPAVESVVVGGKTLAENEYSVAYSNNIEVGQGRVTITGLRAYQGTTYVNFDITPILTELDISYGGNSRTWASYYTEEKSLQVPEGLEAYVVTAVTTEEVLVEQIDYIPQGQAVLLKRVSDDIEEPITTIPYEGVETTQENLMQGTAEPLAVASMESNVYVLYNDCFTRATSDTIPAGRGYLVLEQEASARLSIVEGVTGLTPVQPSTFNLQPYYDLQGRKVDEPAGRQLLIKNSKKYFFR
jgi:hypothetical protein